QMVFAHIHYNRFLELCAILFLLISFFCHKNMHLQKCLTFGVHIKPRPFFVLQTPRQAAFCAKKNVKRVKIFAECVEIFLKIWYSI
ncbi:MAG TPA: hypothetical protein H9741_06170, partial [Candidatus Borkfalkia faecipullorum]|nr:hypothetical protein [Candidatus Borkfalkia faecipullorum]